MSDQTHAGHNQRSLRTKLCYQHPTRVEPATQNARSGTSYNTGTSMQSLCAPRGRPVASSTHTMTETSLAAQPHQERHRQPWPAQKAHLMHVAIEASYAIRIPLLLIILNSLVFQAKRIAFQHDRLEKLQAARSYIFAQYSSNSCCRSTCLQRCCSPGVASQCHCYT